MNSRLKRMYLIGILGIVALGVAACGGVASAAPEAQGATPVAATTTPTSDIGVTGTGRVFSKPDTAVASLGVENTATTLAGALSDVRTRMTAVVDKVKAMGVDEKDIQTVNYSVNPITSNPKEGETPRITGYHVANMVQVKIRNLDQVGAILDAAIGAGANSMNSLYFTIDDPTALQKDARTKAVQDAIAKGKTLADAAGVKLGPIVSVSENVSSPRPVYDRALALPAAAPSAGLGPVETGQTEVDVTVEVHWAISQ